MVTFAETTTIGNISRQFFHNTSMDRGKTILMQGGTPSDTGLTAYEPIYEHFTNVWITWPNKSLDLNGTENVFSRLKDSIFTEPRPKNKQQLIERLQDEWDAVEAVWKQRILDYLKNGGNHSSE